MTSMIPSRSEFLTIRGLRTHVRHWGREGAPKLFMRMAGWTCRRLVPVRGRCPAGRLARDRPRLARLRPDRAPGTDTYWFPDYLADLDAILDHYSPGDAVNLLGHSMGGNIVSVYAGVRPERVAQADQPGRLRPARRPAGAGAGPLRQVAGRAAVAAGDAPLRQPGRGGARLQKTNPRLPRRARRLPGSTGRRRTTRASGKSWATRRTRCAGPLLYHVEEVLACWRRITAPVLWVEAEQTNMWMWMGPKEQARAEVERRMGHLRDVTCKMPRCRPYAASRPAGGAGRDDRGI
jgi:pimeloyl-ACP methyl ester carboxylesterase